MHGMRRVGTTEDSSVAISTDRMVYGALSGGTGGASKPLDGTLVCNMRRQQYISGAMPTSVMALRSDMSWRTNVQYCCHLSPSISPHVMHRTGALHAMLGL